jgi:hypothetical protein
MVPMFQVVFGASTIGAFGTDGTIGTAFIYKAYR